MIAKRALLPSWTPARVRAPLATARRMVAGARLRRAHPGAESLQFICNLCGKRSHWLRQAMVREATTCVHCGSSVRMREVVAAVSREVLGTSSPARDWPARKDLVGIGFSDSELYSGALARATSYTNTWFHQAPLVDVTDIESFGGKQYDFAVCSDVLEHVPAPADRAFRNLFAILRPGGTLVLNFPMRDGETVEHYPELTEFDTEETSAGWTLKGVRPDGQPFESNDVVFHGGPGTTVEMRVFGRTAVRRTLEAVGFVNIVEHVEEDEGTGIVHAGTPEFLDTPGGRVVGMHAGVWTANRPLARPSSS